MGREADNAKNEVEQAVQVSQEKQVRSFAELRRLQWRWSPRVCFHGYAESEKRVVLAWKFPYSYPPQLRQSMGKLMMGATGHQVCCHVSFL